MSLGQRRAKVLTSPVLVLWVVLLLAFTPIFSSVQAKPALQTALAVSDDFSGCALNTNLWTQTDPLADGNISLDGENLVITIPAGGNHTIDGTGPATFINTVTRITQPSNNTSFEVEVKFASGVEKKYQMQGILVQDNDLNLLRVEFFSEGKNTVFYVAKLANGVRSTLVRADIGVPGLAPLYMKVNRTGLVWTISWKTDGTEWVSTSFEHTLRSNLIGVYSGSTSDVGGTPPGNTTRVDYFFNTASPISPEDGNKNTVSVTLNGQGTVTRSPDKASYACNEMVELTAQAETGWSFVNWAGDATGSNPTTSVKVVGKMAVTANFAPGSSILENRVYIPLLSR